jgi:hypothetical protein
VETFAQILNPSERRLDQRHGFFGAVVDPDNEVFLKLTQRRSDLPVALDLSFEDPDVP